MPKAKGGRERVPVHPICHRTIHRHFSNAELARDGDAASLRAHPEIAGFLEWIEGKPPDFHAPTLGKRR